MDLDTLSRMFVEHYYNTFDTSRETLAVWYQEQSMLTFEGNKTQGAEAISDKLNALGFQQCKHNISTVDCQLSGPSGGVIVFVTGNLQLPDEEHLLKFSQMFHLIPTLEGSFYIFNDMFRLNYA
ncbi:nuclear transport factor 2B [Physcomitrium patens]|uniref:NTF2 domain-containing protein n=1 Tax=Physcomitrium patens TaxID=3218 RepID=A9RIC1_PHYPA|nr:nuclear transport factor 2B-like [Physcomitrium patens]PNR45169.1 hypothetical protein PHYPA_014940 [Physcomitrium patens]|eukprot:XP_024388404.1 nuclear transport factor 2B-like [Physcomitrella patens]